MNYRLKKPVVLTNLFKKPEFDWEKESSGHLEFFSGRILGLHLDQVSIGDTVTVCINRTALEFSQAQIEKWLQNFGTVAGSFNYATDKYGIKTDNIEVELKISRHIPEYLPMYSRKIRIFYLGIPKQCNNCLEIGHIKVDCEGEKKDWFSFIEELIDSGDFKRELFGDWPEIIKNKRKLLKSKQNELPDKSEKKV